MAVIRDRMQAVNFIKEAQKSLNPVIMLNDVARIIGKGREYSRVYIHRLKNRNLIREVERGKYALTDDPFEIASGIVFPSYISFISAYSIYGLTTQMPSTIHVVALRSRKPISAEGVKIEFIRLRKQNFFGYKREKFRDKYIFIAEPEKAIIDALYLPRYCPISESYEALKGKEISPEKLIEYALRIGSCVVIKRLGYLLELHNIDIYESVKHRLNHRYDLLNPYMKKSKRTSKKWRISINEVFE